ncbi:unnamed protein product [Rotaria sordida]|uniref:Uncharacterized protein n=1 Tax=Rotaria sordida TaxID=392033 RepID=A0A813NQ76_9BILA|nr:unnamed protein product [Rotaria sordida]
MHQINLLNNIKIKENQNINNEEYENRINRKSIYSRKTIILILIAVIAGLAFALETSNSMNTTILSTIKHTIDSTNTNFSNNTLLSITMPITTTTITKTIVTTTTDILTRTIRIISMNTTTAIATRNLSVTMK